MIERFHEVLDYRFAPIDQEHHLTRFKSERSDCLRRIAGEEKIPMAKIASPQAQARSASEFFRSQLDGDREDTSIVEIEDSLYNTRQCLLKMLNMVATNGAFSDHDELQLDVFQRKFEVFHRVYTLYDCNYKKRGTNWQDSAVYSLLGLCLIIRFQIERNSNDLSSAIKLVDVLLKSGIDVSEPLNPILALLIQIESAVLTESYGY
ncbi:MAG: hypothetical protein KDD53_12025 [Bdellovibrionales bacterium]|nr:hypothetical protein [Bdellovibrionales bacterium]